MHSVTSTPPFSLDHAPPSRSTVPHSQGLTHHGHHTAASWDSQYLKLLSRGSRAVPIFEVPQSSSRPYISAPQVVPCSSDAALSLEFFVDQHRPQSIDPRMVDLTRDFWVTQGNASDFITNHVDTALPSYTSPRLPHVAEWPSGYPWESRDIPTFGDLDNSFAAPTMGPIPSPHDCTAGPNAPWPRLSNSAAPPPREPYPSDDFAIGNVPLPSNQGPFLNISHPTNPLHALQYIPGHQPLTCILPLSNPMSYSTSHGYNQYYPPFPTLNQDSPSWIPQDHFGYSSPVQPHYAVPVHPPGFHGGVGILGDRYEVDSHHELSHQDTIQYMYKHLSRLEGVTSTPRRYSDGLDDDSKIRPRAPGILDNHVARIHDDHPSHTLSDHEAHRFCDYAAYVSGERTAGGGVDDYGGFDEGKVNSERPQLLLPSNRLPLSPRKLHSHDCVSPIAARGLSRTSRRARRSVTAQSRSSTKPRKVCYRNASTPCGWRDDTGSECGEPVNCGNYKVHFATAHYIKNMAERVIIICRWCRSQRAVMRKNFPRHLKEVHLGSARSKKES
ncbi:hypothetical protein EDD15DRAFT_2367706 [Pisolithus albus]|nr:hypothetical protein EDD15DRAFT_2367706 [Pisolithus albus]